jgi:4,5-dihydroxyphthalate decarboxylase
MQQPGATAPQVKPAHGLQLSIGVGRYDRTQALLDGRVQVKGLRPQFVSPPLEELFARAFDTGEYELAELSFSNYLYLTSRGDCRYVGLPVFPSRMFRHSAIFIRADRGIRTARDLIGRTIGVREFSNTAALVARGVLDDEYGVGAESVHWRWGPTDAFDSTPIMRVQPRDIDLAPIAVGTNLSDLLRDGEIDAMVAYSPPRCFLEGAPDVRRLFPDPVKVEQDYYARTGIFPIMHLIGIRKDIAEKRPEIIRPVLEAFDESKRRAVDALAAYQSLAVALPWAAADLAQTTRIMGTDYWPYGVARNRAAISTIARYSHRQGLASRQLEFEELFAPGSLDWNP